MLCCYKIPLVAGGAACCVWLQKIGVHQGGEGGRGGGVLCAAGPFLQYSHWWWGWASFLHQVLTSKACSALHVQ